MSIGLVAITGLAAVHAATTYDVHNVPDMTLSVRISATQTTGIKINPPRRNGLTVTFPTTSGGVLEFRQGTKIEQIYYSLAQVNATTKVITLSGTVVRDLSWNSCLTYGSNSAGQIFTPGGTTVRLVNDCRLFNLKLNKDRSNILTASGALTFSGSGSLAIPTFSSTILRNQQLGTTPGGPVRVSCVTAMGACYYYLGGAWTSFGSGAQLNATDAVSGKVQIITASDLGNLTSTGSTGAQNVLTPRWVIKNGSGGSSASRIVMTDERGVILASLGGLGRRNPTQSGVLVGNGSSGALAITASASGRIIRSNVNRTYVDAAFPAPAISKVLLVPEKIITAVGDTNFTSNYPIQASTILTGSVIELHASGSGGSSGADFAYGLKLGSTELCASDHAGGARNFWTLKATITFIANGAVGRMLTDCYIFSGPSVGTQTASGSSVTLNTTISNNVNVFNRSNGTNAYSYIKQLIVKTFTP